MSKLRLECPVCGSVYELGSISTAKPDAGSISCFVCGQTIFAYEGCVSFYPFLINRKENHLKFFVDDMPPKALSGNTTMPPEALPV